MEVIKTHQEKMLLEETDETRIESKHVQPNVPDDKEDEEETQYDSGNDEQVSASSEDSEHFFEGVEKRLMLYLANKDGGRFNRRDDDDDEDSDSVCNSGDDAEMNEPDLRKITKTAWEKMLELVSCRIVSIISNEHIDAYLLSESSMFVSQKSVMVKTCGQTTLLHCLDSMLKLVKEAGFDLVEDVFYSHKNMLLPSLQIYPHDSIAKEINYLDKAFRGVAHQFGHIDQDRWYLYALNKTITARDRLNKNEHFKFEMIMEEVDAKVMALFFRSNHPESVTASEVTTKAGIDTIFPGMTIDDHFFDPCGYSMNGLLGKHYTTIHITPEAEFSFVSFETDLPQTNYPGLIEKLVTLFNPGKFMVNIFVPSIELVKRRVDVDNLNGIGSLNANLDTVHGLNLYEQLLSDKFLGEKFVRANLQMAHYKHADIIFARYVAIGIS